ncbi:MAG: DUF1232 domain-containing protein [Myxococcota bacterium]|nr:DUF1232 domain-containing protein [Myxococcota bacterium]
MNAKDNSGGSVLGTVAWGLVGLLGVIYLLNPTAGILELVPDNIPFVGNLDEATATYLVLAALKKVFNIDLSPKVRLKKDSLEPRD